MWGVGIINTNREGWMVGLYKGGKQMKEIRKIYNKIEFDAMMVLEFDESSLKDEIIELGRLIRGYVGEKEIRLEYHLSPTIKDSGKMLLCINVCGEVTELGEKVWKYMEKKNLKGKIEIY